MPRRPDPYAAAVAVRLSFVVHGRKPAAARLPGLDVVVAGRYGSPPRYVWRCCLNGLLAN